MPIRIYDSMARKLLPLTTREEGKVSMYTCGPTVYNYIHIGNARTLIWFDLIRRYLAYRGLAVTYVTNYTDVDDKIIERARAEGIPPETVTQKYTRAFEEDMSALGVKPSDITCRATDHILEMVESIAGLVASGAAYDIDGDVFFSIESFPRYGALSGRSVEDMRAGERVEPHPGKRHPLDFALWKAAKEGEPSWSSPWGPGRPGWHIECSVMSTKYLGMGFDIHGGGSDLVFPHHENEIAQAEAPADERFVRHWMHSGMVQMESEKMSKSLGNVVLAREANERFGGPTVRYWALMSSYGSQPAFSESSLEDASAALQRWQTFHSSAVHSLGISLPGDPPAVRPLTGDDAKAPDHVRRFIEAMDDNFNSAQAFAVIHDLVREGNRSLAQGAAGKEALVTQLSQFLEVTGMLGFNFTSSAEDASLVPDLVAILLDLREAARKEKAFERGDMIRDRLQAAGVVIEDTAEGPRWRAGD